MRKAFTLFTSALMALCGPLGHTRAASEPTRTFSVIAGTVEVARTAGESSHSRITDQATGIVTDFTVKIDSVSLIQETGEYRVVMHSDISGEMMGIQPEIRANDDGTYKDTHDGIDSGYVVRSIMEASYIMGRDKEFFQTYLLTKFSGEWKLLDPTFTISERKLQFGCISIFNRTQWDRKSLTSNSFSYVTGYKSAMTIISNTVEVGGKSSVRIKRGTSNGYIFESKLIVYRSSKLSGVLLCDDWFDKQ